MQTWAKDGGGGVQLASLIRLRVRSYAHPENRKNPICARFIPSCLKQKRLPCRARRGWRAGVGGGGGGVASLINTPITGYQGVFASCAARPHLPGSVFRRVDGEAESLRSSRPPPPLLLLVVGFICGCCGSECQQFPRPVPPRTAGVKRAPRSRIPRGGASTPSSSKRGEAAPQPARCPPADWTRAATG